MDLEIKQRQMSVMDVLLSDRAFMAAEALASSDLVPKSYRGRPSDVLVAMAWGHGIGLNPLQALKSISVINGTPALWGDAITAICRAHRIDVKESITGDVATCTVIRPGQEPVTRYFSVEDAKRAGLWSKNTWAQYPQRMLAARARGFAVRDACADLLMGFITIEEAEDYPNGTETAPKADTLPQLPAPTRSEILDAVLRQTAPAPAHPAHVQGLIAACRAGRWQKEQIAAMLKANGYSGVASVPPEDAQRISEILSDGYDVWAKQPAPMTSNEADWLAIFVDGGWSSEEALKAIRSQDPKSSDYAQVLQNMAEGGQK